mmetsp:Transcript_12542/g.24761  ORF Transcript_12542/g.24761 Transcript_12542/m.24761 type:complete len:411 (-) Transcript_12542:2530-3762(-)
MSYAPQSVPVLRWGIMGTANIATKNARAMALSPSANLVAVASRDAERCSRWVREHACKPVEEVSCYGSYDGLLDDPDVDAVYIPLPTTMHAEWVAKAASKGKHVLVEKPVGVDLKQVAAMAHACAKEGKLFMDGVMFMHHERLLKVEEQLRGDPGGFFGPVTRVNSAFTFEADAAFLEGGNIRTQASGDPLGCLGDLGLYCVRVGQAAFGWDSPPATARAVRVRRNSSGVPIDVTAEVYWPLPSDQTPPMAAGAAVTTTQAEPTLSFHCSFLHPMRQNVEIVGSGRTISMDDFVISDPDDAAFTLTRSLGQFDKATIIGRDIRKFGTGRSLVQEAAMFDNFAATANAIASRGSRDSAATDSGAKKALRHIPEFWPAVAMQTQAILDAILASDSQGGAEVPVPPVPPVPVV